MSIIKYIAVVVVAAAATILLDVFSLPQILFPLGMGAALVVMILINNGTKAMLRTSILFSVTTLILIGIFSTFCLMNNLPIIETFLSSTKDNFTRIDLAIWAGFSGAIVSFTIYLLSRIHEKFK